MAGGMTEHKSIEEVDSELKTSERRSRASEGVRVVGFV